MARAQKQAIPRKNASIAIIGEYWAALIATGSAIKLATITFGSRANSSLAPTTKKPKATTPAIPTNAYMKKSLAATATLLMVMVVLGLVPYDISVAKGVCLVKEFLIHCI